MKDGERGRPIENYGKKEQKEWLDHASEARLYSRRIHESEQESDKRN